MNGSLVLEVREASSSTNIRTETKSKWCGKRITKDKRVKVAENVPTAIFEKSNKNSGETCNVRAIAMYFGFEVHKS